MPADVAVHASMMPPPIGRKNDLSDVERADVARGFNDAAPNRAEERAQFRLVSAITGRFNDAAPNRAEERAHNHLRYNLL